MPGVISERDGRSVGGANAAMGTEQQDLFTAQLLRIPSHARVLSEPEKIAGWAIEQHFGG